MISTAGGEKRFRLNCSGIFRTSTLVFSTFDQGMADLSDFPSTTATTVLLRSIKDLEDLKKSEEQEWKREYWFQEDKALIKRQYNCLFHIPGLTKFRNSFTE